MTRYFMQGTPLFQLEQQMMTPPNFQPRGHGLSRPAFHYQAKDIDCQYCANYSQESLCRCANAFAWRNESRAELSALRK